MSFTFTRTTDAPLTRSETTPELPIRMSKLSMEIDYTRGGPIKAVAEGWLLNPEGDIVLNLEPEMIAIGRDGKRYRLVKEPA